MMRMSAAVAAALVLGVLVTPAADAARDPVYDPGAPRPGTFVLKAGLSGGETSVDGRFAERSVTLRLPSYVKDTADDGLDARLWVLYGKYNGVSYKEPIAIASGVGVKTDVVWAAPANVVVDWFEARVCLGPGEDRCSKWVG
ncbi:hypothetical protein [Lentzea nigeriaca]|uniref:hypothetical protein n=1 Tax=Lentzea nigeriaca TaxID=1128665 RepID=UPI00195D4178|nr:hypothetical protein [Lentzea nigeriaca]MBM7858928.1 hypothetical protein [Lentzea nigeriaca]